MCIHQTVTRVYLLVASNTSSNGHFCLVVVDALVGGQQSKESQTGSHHSSVKWNRNGYVNHITVTPCFLVLDRVSLVYTILKPTNWYTRLVALWISFGAFVCGTSHRNIPGNRQSIQSVSAKLDLLNIWLIREWPNCYSYLHVKFRFHNISH